MIKRNFKARIHYLLWHSDMEATRFTLGVAALMWAVFLWWPGDLFPTVEEVSAGRGRLTYAIMAQIMDEDWWALLWFAQGSVMLWSLMTGIRNCKLMVIDAMLGVMLWTICVGSAFIVYWPKADFWTAVMIYKPPAAMAGEIGMIFASWWVLIRYQCAMDSHARSNCK
jgi:hypothetical protein